MKILSEIKISNNFNDFFWNLLKELEKSKKNTFETFIGIGKDNLLGNDDNMSLQLLILTFIETTQLSSKKSSFTMKKNYSNDNLTLKLIISYKYLKRI